MEVQQIYEALRPFARMVAEELAKMQQPSNEQPASPRQLRGISGIMEIFHCSRSKAAKIKDSGIIDEAITYISGRLFLVNEQKALHAYEKRRRGRIKS